MKSRFLLCSVLTACAVATSADAVNVRIIGGNEARLQDYPFISGLVNKGDSALNVGCGASVIAPQWVMTAAHCLPDTNADAYEVIVNTADLSVATEANRVGVAEVIVHPEYNDEQILNDIALLRLSSAVDAAPIKVATVADQAAFAEGQAVSVAGWGNLSADGEEFPQRLHSVDLNVSNFASCSNAYGGLPDSNICASVPDGSKDSCQGDSGGPLIARTENGPVQIGVVSFGEGCASATHPGVYTRVSSYQSFLARAFDDAPAQPAAVPVTQIPNEMEEGSPQDEPVDQIPVAVAGEVEFVWVADFDNVEVGEQAFAYAEVFNGSDSTVVLGDAALEANANVSIEMDYCSGVELAPADFCYIDLLWQVENDVELEGSLTISAFDGAATSKFQLSLEGATLEPLDIVPVEDIPDAEFLTNDDELWVVNEEDPDTHGGITSDLQNTDLLTLEAEFDWEDSFFLGFDYQLDGVVCIVYIDGIPSYELASAQEWQQVSVLVPAGASVRWKFFSWEDSTADRSEEDDSNEVHRVKLDGFKRLPVSAVDSSSADIPVVTTTTGATSPAGDGVSEDISVAESNVSGGAASSGVWGLWVLTALMLMRRTRQNIVTGEETIGE